MSTQLLEDTEERLDTGSRSPAHIVKGKAKVTEAYVMGTPLEALCGKVFVPKRDPENRPVCEACKQKREEMLR